MMTVAQDWNLGPVVGCTMARGRIMHSQKYRGVFLTSKSRRRKTCGGVLQIWYINIVLTCCKAEHEVV